ncbi:AMP-binding protein [Altererythrobacter aquaemixtae]|uniref:AMP-binding protein n=1 Tax=Pontixanthobacter aquaemixtae TaxID=1958940 RepID=A0A844ZT02_9SPHN|nr:AMP-binding protein [Pontixanthobacter aquaemixtae]
MRDDRSLSGKARAAGHWVDSTIADALEELAQADGNRTLLVDGAVRLNASELWARSQRLAAYLQSKYDRGSVVSFMLPNWHEAAIVYLGATLAGMVANPILPSLRDHDLRFILADAETSIVFIPVEFRGFSYADMLRRVAGELKGPTDVVTVRGSVDGFDNFETVSTTKAARDRVDLDADDVRMIMYTSGTTGRPKGVLHTHNTIHALIRQIGEHWLVDRGDKFLVPSPVSHIGGSIYAFESPLLLGTTAVLMDQWDANAAVPLMLSEKITHMAGATPFLQHLLAAARDQKTRLPDLKVFICGGASVPPSLIREANDYFDKARVSRVYGSTEVPVTTVGALDAPAMPEAAETDGKPGIAEVRLGEASEICAYGPQMLLGYAHPEDEQVAFDEQGFYRTGDQGRMTDSGAVVVTGRIKDLIIRNGENIAPKEIEDLLLGLEEIEEVAIVGIPDERTGERACAVIVPAAGAQPDVTLLGEFLAGFGVAKFKYPERVDLRANLPKNEAGKVLKHVLRNELAGG